MRPERSKGSEQPPPFLLQTCYRTRPQFRLSLRTRGTGLCEYLPERTGDRKHQAGICARDRTSELEKLYISTHYFDIVTGEEDKAKRAYQLWKRTYPRDSIQPLTWQTAYSIVGEWDQALAEAQETMRLAPNDALSYQVLSGAYLGSEPPRRS